MSLIFCNETLLCGSGTLAVNLLKHKKSQQLYKNSFMNCSNNNAIKKLTVPTHTCKYCHLQKNPKSSSLQFEVVYWPALAVGGAAQLEAAECPNICGTLGPQSAARQTHLCPSCKKHKQYGSWLLTFVQTELSLVESVSWEFPLHRVQVPACL